LGSGITSTTGNPIETIIDNKILLTDMGNVITAGDEPSVACAELAEAEITKQLRYLHIAGNAGVDSDVGYYFPNTEQVSILCEKRRGTWHTVRIDPVEVENTFATVWIPHGTYPQQEGYAYVLLPGKTAEETKAYSEVPDVEIIESSEAVHAVRDRSMLGINFWEGYQCPQVKKKVNNLTFDCDEIFWFA